MRQMGVPFPASTASGERAEGEGCDVASPSAHARPRSLTATRTHASTCAFPARHSRSHAPTQRASLLLRMQAGTVDPVPAREHEPSNLNRVRSESTPRACGFKPRAHHCSRDECGKERPCPLRQHQRSLHQCETPIPNYESRLAGTEYGHSQPTGPIARTGSAGLRIEFAFLDEPHCGSSCTETSGSLGRRSDREARSRHDRLPWHEARRHRSLPRLRELPTVRVLIRLPRVPRASACRAAIVSPRRAGHSGRFRTCPQVQPLPRMLRQSDTWTGTRIDEHPRRQPTAPHARSRTAGIEHHRERVGA